MKWLVAFTLLLAGAAMAQGVPDRAPPDLGGTAFGDASGVLDGADPASTLQSARADEAKRAVLTVLARNGCRIAERDVERIFAPEGLTFEVVSGTLAELYLAGVAREDSEGALMVPASLCPPDRSAQTPKDRILAAFAANACTLTEQELRTMPGLSDLSEGQRNAVLGPMEEAGEVETGADGITLSEALCRS